MICHKACCVNCNYSTPIKGSTNRLSQGRHDRGLTCLLRAQIMLVKAKRRRYMEIHQHLERLIFEQPWSRELTCRKITHVIRGRDATAHGFKLFDAEDVC